MASQLVWTTVLKVKFDNNIYITVSQVNGNRSFFDIREYIEDRPTKIGVCLSLSDFIAFKASLFMMGKYTISSGEIIRSKQHLAVVKKENVINLTIPQCNRLGTVIEDFRLLMESYESKRTEDAVELCEKIKAQFETNVS